MTKTSINLGLIHIPVSLRRLATSNRVRFNLIDQESGQRIKYKKETLDQQKEVKPSALTKGVKVDEQTYVAVTAEDFEKVRPGNSISVVHFCLFSEIPSYLIDKSYLVLAQKGAERPLALLKKAINGKAICAVAKYLTSKNEELVVLTTFEQNLVMFSLYYHDELNQLADNTASVKLSNDEMRLANNLIKSMTKKFKHDTFKNEYQTQLKKLISNKKKTTSPKRKSGASTRDDHHTADLMLALQKSIKAHRASA